jgi:hypothetical protein
MEPPIRAATMPTGHPNEVESKVRRRRRDQPSHERSVRLAYEATSDGTRRSCDAGWSIKQLIYLLRLVERGLSSMRRCRDGFSYINAPERCAVAGEEPTANGRSLGRGKVSTPNSGCQAGEGRGPCRLLRCCFCPEACGQATRLCSIRAR